MDGNSMGLVKLNNNKEKNINQKGHRQLSFTALFSDGKNIFPLYNDPDENHSGSITISGNELEIGVSDFSYVNPENEEIEYIVEGLQKRWKRIPAYERIHLENLKGGENRLLVRRPGEPDSEISLEINVKSNRALIILFSILGLILSGSALFLFYRKKSYKKLSEENEQDKEKKRYISSRISEDDCRALYENIEKIMAEKKPYLNSEFKIQDLANMVGSSSFALSYLFNQYLKIGYLNYINGFRVEEFKKIVAEEGTSKYTLTGIALKCGFSSRASFFRHFKSSTGLTPSQYIKETQKD